MTNSPPPPSTDTADYEDQLTAFIDLLGFSEVSRDTDETRRLAILALLKDIASLRSDFYLRTEQTSPTVTSSQIRPAVSTFSDHIVISYPLSPMRTEIGDVAGLMVAVNNLTSLLAKIAAAALRIGFLIRGGVTIGKLYHSRGVAFGPALVTAVEVESRVAVYPRVVLSHEAACQEWFVRQKLDVEQSRDGLCCLKYVQRMVLEGARPGPDYRANLEAWLRGCISLISKNLVELRTAGRLHELAKWTWFSHEFERAFRSSNPNLMSAMGLSEIEIPWARAENADPSN